MEQYNTITTLKQTKFIHSTLCIHHTTQIKYIQECIDLEYYKQSKFPLETLLNNPHSNLQQIHDHYQSDTHITLIMAYCVGGNILDYIHKHGAYPTNKARKLFTQMLSVIPHIQSLNLCPRRDIRPEDILLTDHTSLSIQLSHSIFTYPSSTTFYQSPQMHEHLTTHQQMKMNSMNHNNDVWSLGILLYLMLNGSLPNIHYQEFIDIIRNKSLKWHDTSISSSAKDLIYQMLQIDAEKRVSIQQIKRHPFMLGLDDMIQKKYTLKQKILYALRTTKLRPIPSQKEMQESFAFFEKTQKCFKKHDVIIDVCGSHGLISYLFALYCRTPFIYIIDSHKPKSFDMIGKALNIREGTIEYISKDLYESLPELLEFWKHKNNQSGKAKKLAVIACHACAHLSDSIMDICYEYDMTEFALMPCCHARTDHHHQVGAIMDTLNVDLCHRKSETGACDVNVKNLQNEDKVIDAGIVKDMIMFGRGIQMGYSMRWKMIQCKITPQNRILFGLKQNEKEKQMQKKIINKRKVKMEHVYHKNDL
eukprot:70539_1